MMRRVRLMAVVFGLCLIPVLIGLLVVDRQATTGARTDAHSRLAFEASSESARLQNYFAEARRLLLQTSRNTALQDFYAAPGSRTAKLRAGGPLVTRVHEVMSSVENLYRGAISEVCFIDRRGPEVARDVRGVPATMSDLSPDESGNPFFKPTFALPVGAVYQASPYLSPDTHEWVISNSTPLPWSHGPSPAIVHFEVSIESFRLQAEQARASSDVLVVDAHSGRIVFDARRPQRPGGKLGSAGTAWTKAAVARRAPTGMLVVDGRPAAFQHVATEKGNRNDWYVVAVSDTALPTGLAAIGAGPLSVIAAALAALLIGFFVILQFGRGIARRAARYADFARAVAQGDLQARIDVEREPRDELTALAGCLNSVVDPYLSQLSEAADRVAAGDLTTEVKLASDRDQLGTAFGRMVGNLADTVSTVTRAAGTLGSASQQMASTSEETGRAVGEIANAIGEMAQGAERQVEMVDVARGSAEDTTRAADHARTLAEQGATAAESATAAMSAVRESSREVSSAITSLSSKSGEISGIVDTITGIAEQTNLLALNAAIEAARAGDHGRGFAVVAEEVRKLAEESQRSAGSIAALLAEIRDETERAVKIVEEGARRSDEGGAVVEHARQAFAEIASAVRDVSERVDEIARAANEVAAVAEQSSASTEQVSASTEQTTASAQEIAASAQDLARSAEELEQVVGRFTLA